MTFERWDVVAVSFPFVEGTDSKRRPALIVSSERLRQEHGLYWVAMITTAKSTQLRDDIAITNLDRAGLPAECVIRVSRIAAVSEGQIARKLGDVTPKDRTAALNLLRRYVP